MPRFLLALAICFGCEGAEPLAIPSFQRLDLAPTQAVVVPITIHAAEHVVITTAIADCACIRCTTSLPATVPATGSVTLDVRVTGLRPGVEEILFATSAGIVRTQIQIVGPGGGRGADVLRSTLALAQQRHASVIGVVHDLRGQIRHCACSTGSLGAGDRLAALPTFARTLAPDSAIDWILSGDVDGQRPGVGAALATAGWHVDDPRIVVTAHPLTQVAMPGIIAIIPTVPVAIQHRRILRPVLDGGLVVELLLVDTAGDLAERHTMPVDDSLPEDSAFVTHFPDHLTSTIALDAAPNGECLPCHQAAHHDWITSAHAHAWDRLAPADRTDACVGCHTTPLNAATLAPAVQCQACHQDTEAHARSGGATRTTGTLDCRTCHDPQHDPGFQRDIDWARILHGR